jgi:hypothetical protein
MEIRYKDRPSQEAVEKYCRKLEEFLSAHDISVFIELHDIPFKFGEIRNGERDITTNLWVKEVKIKSSKFGEMSVNLFNDGIDENMDERKIWYDALYIQDQIYQNLHLNPQPTWKDSSDPYWKLWVHYPK